MGNTTKYKVKHFTEYSYSEKVKSSEHYLRLKPLSNECQNIEEFSLKIFPKSAVSQYVDALGNNIHYTKIDSEYEKLKIQSEFTALVKFCDNAAIEQCDLKFPVGLQNYEIKSLQHFLVPERLAPAKYQVLKDFMDNMVVSNGYNIVKTLKSLNQAINKDFEYLSSFDDVGVDSFDIFASRRGVCQDFANLFINLSRIVGMPARYVAGYVYLGDDSKNKALKTHAWAEVYVPSLGWLGFDPTNNKIIDENYIALATGVDYLEATPTSGIIFDGGEGEKVDVDISIKKI